MLPAGYYHIQLHGKQYYLVEEDSSKRLLCSAQKGLFLLEYTNCDNDNVTLKSVRCERYLRAQQIDATNFDLLFDATSADNLGTKFVLEMRDGLIAITHLGVSESKAFLAVSSEECPDCVYKCSLSVNSLALFHFELFCQCHWLILKLQLISHNAAILCWDYQVFKSMLRFPSFQTNIKYQLIKIHFIVIPGLQNPGVFFLSCNPGIYRNIDHCLLSLFRNLREVTK